MAIDVTTWMPEGMPADEKAAWAAAYPLSPHRAAALAWEAWAATLTDPAALALGGVESVTTGAQSIEYANGMTEHDVALARARWHWARVPGAAIRSPDYPPVPAVDPCLNGRLLPPTWRDDTLYQGLP